MLYCSPIPVLSNGTCSCSSGVANKNMPPQKHTPLARGVIEPSINNGFSTQSSKKLQLEMLNIDSKLIGL